MAAKKLQQFLFFRAASDYYAIRIESVAEIMIPGQDFRVDFSTDAAHRKCRTGGKSYNGFFLAEQQLNQASLSSVNCRLILLEPSRIGNVLIVDSVEGIIRIEKAGIQKNSGKRGAKVNDFIGGTFMDKEEMVQIIEPRKIGFSVRAR